jgi:hypothetical protein
MHSYASALSMLQACMQKSAVAHAPARGLSTSARRIEGVEGARLASTPRAEDAAVEEALYGNEAGSPSEWLESITHDADSLEICIESAGSPSSAEVDRVCALLRGKSVRALTIGRLGLSAVAMGELAEVILANSSLTCMRIGSMDKSDLPWLGGLLADRRFTVGAVEVTLEAKRRHDPQIVVGII